MCTKYVSGPATNEASTSVSSMSVNGAVVTPISTTSPAVASPQAPSLSASGSGTAVDTATTAGAVGHTASIGAYMVSIVALLRKIELIKSLSRLLFF